MVRGDKEWIGVDLDGTLVHYDKWVGWNVIGPPIAPMVERVKAWIAEGKTVKIMTARVGVYDPRTNLIKRETCRVTGERFSREDMCRVIQDWTMKHVGQRLPVTCVKDVHMIELWDDRAVQVVRNTGRTLAEQTELLSSVRGAP